MPLNDIEHAGADLQDTVGDAEELVIDGVLERMLCQLRTGRFERAGTSQRRGHFRRQAVPGHEVVAHHDDAAVRECTLASSKHPFQDP